MTTHDQHYIGGNWVASASTETAEVIDSMTEEVIGSVLLGTATDVDEAVTAARQAFDGWSSTPVEERSKFLTRIADGIAARADELATTISRETGMTKKLSKQIQVGLPINSFKQAALVAEQFPFEEQRGSSTIVREPIGVVGCITPWNFPLHQISAKVAYAIAAGCSVVLKPSEVAPLDAFILAAIIDEVALPAGVFNLVSGTGPVVGEAIAAHPGVDMVSFTGSTRAGRRVAQLAAETVKKVALELGGKSPNVLLDDLDDAGLATAVRDGVGKAFLNSGQACSALTRMLVPRRRLAAAEQAAAAAVEELVVGDPFADGVHLGPLASAAQRDRVAELHTRGARRGGQARHWRSWHARWAGPRLLHSSHRVFRGHTGDDDRPGGDLRPSSRQSSPTTTRKRRFASPTMLPTDSPLECGRPIRSAPRRSLVGYVPDKSRSTEAPTTPTHRLVATNNRERAESSAASGSKSSSRSRAFSTDRREKRPARARAQPRRGQTDRRSGAAARRQPA